MLAIAPSKFARYRARKKILSSLEIPQNLQINVDNYQMYTNAFRYLNLASNALFMMVECKTALI